MQLVLNAGSSSLKFGAADAGRTIRGRVELGEYARLLLDDTERIERSVRADTIEDAAGIVFAALEERAAVADVQLVAHRIVHGGSEHVAPVRLDREILARLDALAPLAPLHQPAGLALARAALARWPAAVHVACFDTAFHRHWPDAARRFALPRSWHDAGVRRYGFHGLSYAGAAHWLAQQLPAARRSVIAHLGSGASICALRDFASVDCSMGFSALDGLPMTTRCGALDPGAVLHLLRALGGDASRLETMLYCASGLAGVSGTSGDFRALIEHNSNAAREAVELFVYRCAREIAAMTVALDGLDALVFTGGIGEHAPALRAAVVARLAHLGLRLDPAANARNDALIAASGSAVAIAIVAADEESVMLREAAALSSQIAAATPGAARPTLQP
jgi:acetate kinase